MSRKTPPAPQTTVEPLELRGNDRERSNIGDVKD